MIRKALLCASPMAIVAALAASPAVAQEAAALEEIIVTAQKRAQSLQDVPIAITALEGGDLGGLQMDSGTEIARQTPNLNVSVLGNEDQPKFAIRGVSQSQFQLNASSPTGIFYDEVFVRSSFLGGAQLFDMERVEILRGPQGTLFGKGDGRRRGQLHHQGAGVRDGGLRRRGTRRQRLLSARRGGERRARPGPAGGAPRGEPGVQRRLRGEPLPGRPRQVEHRQGRPQGIAALRQRQRLRRHLPALPHPQFAGRHRPDHLRLRPRRDQRVRRRSAHRSRHRRAAFEP
ncbi:Plug domain-containing protein [Phenylobacterium sp. J367]|uniref:Plug domain-containing protein n=1 Tax=Phenylobacterium sp. J367 TaxID=2898435 RepID=UPI002151744E|nr:Plug domain-containing protein [Phenylobacterium sp. J367]MCR5877398.1 Plug domain-containing protein [Phenylobacterium sp. J367]